MKTFSLTLLCTGVASVALLAPPAVRGADDSSAAGGAPHEFTVPLDRQQMIGVTYAPVVSKALHRTIRAVGVVAPTTARRWDYVARVDGYVHDLRVAAPGDRVTRGQVLLDIYSPDLVATENEYIDLLRMRDQARRNGSDAAARDADRLLAAARARLEQWNVSDEQIDAVGRAGRADASLALTSPVDGIVESLGVSQGGRVAVGERLVTLVDLSAVWVWADFYENELPLLRAGSAVTLTSPARPGLVLSARIAVVDPFVDEQKRTGRARIDVDNTRAGLQPGAYLNVALDVDEGAGLTVPVDAVLPTGERNVVFVDRGAGRLEPRFVQLGGQFGDDYRVTAGLRAGERVVSSANFLIDAESKVQGALQSW